MRKLIIKSFLITIFSGLSAIGDGLNFPMTPGTSYSTIGNTAFGSDGTSCTTIGNTVFCN